ncbi:NIF family HAD-type phosphatase [Hyalangium sp.]|uniref:NIF family HAD-type phosphatase n=1 Tax=Hyalangium sp. TaxID=2028555 RepID=UPI002D5897A4|nr:NIF family HAD-type phosphatase [Hyalangium sp.]HYI00919.1 NIF family HAD-type phosphatase [Hyalangium sp.]
MPRFPLLLLLVAPLIGCAAGAATQKPASQPSGAGLSSREELEALSLPPLPLWVDKYADLDRADKRFFIISELMERFQLTRAHAVELQNHYRDQLRATPDTDPVNAFNTALERVRRGEFESHLNLEQLGKARFIVVFDLDETLWDQYYPPEAASSCHDLVIQGGKPPAGRYVKLVPGWQQAFERIQALGGAVVLFSANLDTNVLENLAQWKLNGVALTESPAISGILANSHLILQSKSEGVAPPRLGSPVREPSKDLRIFDESLRRVIIVDDNPTRLFQLRNARIFKKFEADTSCTTSDPVLRRAFEGSMTQVVREIEESVQYMNQHGGDFADAYLPYTSLGQITVELLTGSAGLDRPQAIDYVRRNPRSVDPKF